MHSPSSLKRTFSKCSMDDNDLLLSRKQKVSPCLDDKAVLLLPRSAQPWNEVEPEVSPCSPGFLTQAMLDPDSLEAMGVACVESPTGKDPVDDVSAARIVAMVLDYLRDVAHYCNCAVNWSFAQLQQTLQSVPFAMGQMQSVVKARLGLPWPLVAAFVQNVADFIGDEDIRDASVGELATFLQTWQPASCEHYILAASGNICENLFQLFHDVLQQFKQFLTKHWLQSGRISFPCEFGKKSDSLFLCMECHREHT
ncbi:hypothetical protein PsorP6_009738 [Peronosclerospora sorghi]|uniref:Uncharacterized protein n=1 Tax=Peronosclerospora sorghi TaxID=230839 RepID=A0ACC0W2A6_9STRA|nr:hypothetical protein PsorP6_009738 [Peronosclerospora sorghi]